MKTNLQTNLLLIGVVLVIGIACETAPKPDAKQTAKPGATSPVPEAIAAAKVEAAAALAAVEKKVAAAQAELAALEKRSSVAAAMIASAQSANTNQPPSPATSVVAGETTLALGNLPAPDVNAALEAEKRRAATFAGQADEARRLYATAQSETERMRSEATKLKADTAKALAEADTAKAKADAAHAALLAAERTHTADLERNKAENQARLDDLAAKLKKSEDDRKNAETKEQVRALRLVGLGCLVAGIGIGVMTNGLQLAKSFGFGACALACFGLAQIVASSWFLPVSIGAVVLAIAGGGYWFWRERQDSLKASAMEKQVGVMERIDLSKVQTPDDKGNPSTLAVELAKQMDKPEKAIVKKLVMAKTIVDAKAEAKT